MEDHEIRRAGLKVTLPRLKILEVLEKSGDQHVSAEDVYKMLLQRLLLLVKLELAEKRLLKHLVFFEVRGVGLSM